MGFITMKKTPFGIIFLLHFFHSHRFQSQISGFAGVRGGFFGSLRTGMPENQMAGISGMNHHVFLLSQWLTF